MNTKVLRRKSAQPFQEWAAEVGAEYLPDDFKEWLADLSDAEATDFIRSLDEYASSLDYSLNDLVEGGYDGKPALMQVFVEAIVIYSQEYRKAREVQQAEVDKEETPWLMIRMLPVLMKRNPLKKVPAAGSRRHPKPPESAA